MKFLNKKILALSLFASILGILGIFQTTLAQGVTLQIPIFGQQEISGGIAEYITLIARWVISALSLLATLFIMFGGIWWLTAAGSTKKIQQAKKMITDSLYGLILALGCYLLLVTISPSLVEFKDPTVGGIQGVPFEMGTFEVATASANTSNGSGGTPNDTLTLPNGPPISVTCDKNLFSKYGFPEPTSARTFSLSETRKKTISSTFATASKLTGIEMPFLAMWPLYEGFSNSDGDNCDNSRGKDHNPNTYCYGWDGACEGKYWQVGYGVWPGCEGTRWLKEAFQKVYSDTSNAKVMQVGNHAIANSKDKNKITFISSFPNISLDSIISGSKNGDENSRMLMATLMKDPAISAYLVGKHFSSVERVQKRGTAYAGIMQGWAPKYYQPQKIANTIAGVCMLAKSSSKK